MKIRGLSKIGILFCIIVILLASNSLVVAQPQKETVRKSLFNLQFVLTVSWSANETSEPFLPGELHVIILTIASCVTRGVFGKSILNLLTGRPYLTGITVEETPEWCTAWTSEEYFTQAIVPDETMVMSVPLYIFLNENAPSHSVGNVKIHIKIFDKKGPFDFITLIEGFDQVATLAFVTGS
jgi:hypothetical protein